MTYKSIAFFAGLVLTVAGSLEAHAQGASIEGVARASDIDAPVPFALVRLVHADSMKSAAGPLAQSITTADGRYRFVGMRAGRYRIQLLRIGFQPTLSEPIVIADGQSAQLSLRVSSEPLTLPRMVVTPEACVTSNELAQHPQLETLWQQARDGAQVRMGFRERYRYRTLLREESYEVFADGRSPTKTLDQNYLSDPRTALRNAERTRSSRLSQGYYAPNDGWALPNEFDVLHDDFLKAHCILPTVDHGDGEFGLRFQPIKVRRGFLDVRGTIWLDSATFFARRIELEYVDGEDPRGTVQLNFAGVSVAGSDLRMPIGGVFAIRSSRKNPAKRAEGKLTYIYSAFEEVPPR